MTKQSNEGLVYLDMYPQLRKWINQCVACQRLGYTPQLPEKHVAAKNLRSFFPELLLNEQSLCDQCADALEAPSTDGDA